mmetsp:Transcript_19264/g.47978  ORF Transcript_19264/g.47978 Transcript_19264/m.47978 type:complete len:91 (+) Transcript_19264:1020-1292(+)
MVLCERSRERVVGPAAEATFPWDPIMEKELLVRTADVDVVTPPISRGSIILDVVVLAPLFVVTSVLPMEYALLNCGLGRRTTGAEPSGRP